MERGDCGEEACVPYKWHRCEQWPGSELKYILQVVQHEWDLGKEHSYLEEAKRCEKINSNGRLPEPLSGQNVSAGVRMMHTSSLQRTGSAQGITEGGSHLHARGMQQNLL